jgi:hypothetical protein
VKTCQFSGCATVSAPKLAVTSRELGGTLDKETGPALGSALAEAGWATATPRGAWKTAPFFSLSLAYFPDLAPSAISWAEYNLTPAACCFAVQRPRCWPGTAQGRIGNLLLDGCLTVTGVGVIAEELRNRRRSSFLRKSAKACGL